MPTWLKRLLNVMALGVLGLAVGWGLGSLLPDAPGEAPPLNLWVVIPGIGLALFLVLLMHELGHVLGGWLVGFRFMLLIVGPLKITRTAHGLALGLNTNLTLMGGLAGCMPSAAHAQLPAPALNRRLLVMVLGGPAASWLLAGLAGWAAGLSTGEAGLLLGVLAGTSAGIGVVTLIPGHTGGFTTDGGQALSLWRNDHTATARAALLVLQAASLGGTRPRDLDPRWLERALEASASPLMHLAARLMAYSAALDRGEVAAAGQHLDVALARQAEFPAGFRQTITLEGAYFEAAHRRNLPAAERWLALSAEGVVEAVTRHRAEAAVHQLAGRREQAQASAQAGLRALPAMLDRGAAQAEAEWLADIDKMPG